MKIKRIFALIFAFALSFVASKFVLDFLDQRSNANIYAGGGTFEDQAVKTSKDEYLILMVGVDQAAGEENNEDFTRTDTIMLMKANVKDGTIKLLSIPRDSRVLVRNTYDKVNHAHAFGGIELTLQSLRNFLGLDIDYYAQVNYQALVNIVDAIGGVDYEVPEGVEIKKWTLDIKPGMNHFDGTDTMWYLRTRHIYNNGDIGRVEAQQDFIKAMVDQAVLKSKQMNLMTVISSYIKYVKTNLPMSAIVDLVKNINNFSSDKVDTFIVPGNEATINRTSYYIPDERGTWDIVDEEFGDFKLKKWTEEVSGLPESEYSSINQKAPVNIFPKSNSYNNSHQQNNSYNNYNNNTNNYNNYNNYNNSYDNNYNNSYENNYYEPAPSYEEPAKANTKPKKKQTETKPAPSTETVKPEPEVEAPPVAEPAPAPSEPENDPGVTEYEPSYDSYLQDTPIIDGEGGE